MSVLPPSVQLARVVGALTADLPVRWSTLLADDRWADVAESLRRLAVPGAVDAIAADLGDDESARLADLLLARWAAVGDPVLPPAAAIVGPVGPTGPVGTELAVVVDGLDEGWSATWHGPVDPVDAEDPNAAVVRLRAGAPAPIRVSVRVFGRSAAGRHILAARIEVPDGAG